MNQISLARLSEFLVDAKRKTYAGLDDDATVLAPMLPGSKQLEYRDLDLSYRDIYFGMRFFVGQETVQVGQHVVWSMSYAGGVAATVVDRNEFLSIYAFLRQALLAIRDDRPFRGPPQFENERVGCCGKEFGLIALPPASPASAQPSSVSRRSAVRRRGSPREAARWPRPSPR